MSPQQATQFVLQAIPILAQPGISNDEAIAQLQALGHSAVRATKLCVLVPEALAWPVLKQLGMKGFPTHFDVINRAGDTVQLPVSGQSLFGAALVLGEAVFEKGWWPPLRREAYEAVAGRSAGIDGANRVFNAGGNLQDAEYASLALDGLVAEDMLEDELV